MNLLKSLVVVLLFSSSAFAQSAQDYYNKAKIKYKNKEYASAAIEYTRAIDKQPKSAVLYSNRGLCYYKTEKWNDALTDYQRALEIDPKYKQAHLNMGNVYADKEQFNRALLSYDKALKIDPNYVLVYAKRGFVYYKLDDYSSALKDYNIAIERSSSPSSVWYNARGVIHDKLGDRNEAIADYDKTLQLNPSAYATYINRGILKTHLKKYDAAIKDFTVAQSFAGMNGDGYYYRGLCRVGKLDAIRTSKEKHFVMDIKSNGRLLELACSDFKKAKSLSYGRAFDAYQEYCSTDYKNKMAAEDKTENTKTKKKKKSSNKKEKKTSVAVDNTKKVPLVEEKVVLPPKTEEPLVDEEETVSFTKSEMEEMRRKMKAEILAEMLKELDQLSKSKVQSTSESEE